MAAKCCWSPSCQVSARPRWSIARAEAKRERRGGGAGGRAVVEVTAGSSCLDHDLGFFHYPDRAFTALVDIAGGDLCGPGARCDGAFLRCEGFPAIAEPSDFHFPARAVCAGGGRNPLVRRAMGRAALCDRPNRKTADAAGPVLSLRTLQPWPAGVHGH